MEGVCFGYEVAGDFDNVSVIHICIEGKVHVQRISDIFSTYYSNAVLCDKSCQNLKDTSIIEIPEEGQAIVRAFLRTSKIDTP